MRRLEPAAEHTHALLLSIHHLAGVDRYAVRRGKLRDPEDDTLIVARRRTHQTERGATPDPEQIRSVAWRRRRRLRQCAACAERGDNYTGEQTRSRAHE